MTDIIARLRALADHLEAVSREHIPHNVAGLTDQWLDTRMSQLEDDAWMFFGNPNVEPVSGILTIFEEVHR